MKNTMRASTYRHPRPDSCRTYGPCWPQGRIAVSQNFPPYLPSHKESDVETYLSDNGNIVLVTETLVQDDLSATCSCCITAPWLCLYGKSGATIDSASRASPAKYTSSPLEKGPQPQSAPKEGPTPLRDLGKEPELFPWEQSKWGQQKEPSDPCHSNHPATLSLTLSPPEWVGSPGGRCCQAHLHVLGPGPAPTGTHPLLGRALKGRPPAAGAAVGTCPSRSAGAGGWKGAEVAGAGEQSARGG